jgi:YidC/Oxa1 family membrane protein insertase
MDRNSIVGIVLIFLILIGFSYLNRPSKEQIAAAKRTRDSIEQVEAAKQREAEIARDAVSDSLQLAGGSRAVSDSAAAEQRKEFTVHLPMQLRALKHFIPLKIT